MILTGQDAQVSSSIASLLTRAKHDSKNFPHNLVLVFLFADTRITVIKAILSK